jgi:hypothetical protein
VDQIECAPSAVVFRARCWPAGAACPGCGTWSSRVHGSYVRQVRDLPLGGRPVLIHLAMRRFLCQNPACAKVTFAGQAGGLIARYQRWSVPLAAAGSTRSPPGGAPRRWPPCANSSTRPDAPIPAPASPCATRSSPRPVALSRWPLWLGALRVLRPPPGRCGRDRRGQPGTALRPPPAHRGRRPGGRRSAARAGPGSVRTLPGRASRISSQNASKRAGLRVAKGQACPVSWGHDRRVAASRGDASGPWALARDRPESSPCLACPAWLVARHAPRATGGPG